MRYLFQCDAILLDRVNAGRLLLFNVWEVSSCCVKISYMKSKEVKRFLKGFNSQIILGFKGTLYQDKWKYSDDASKGFVGFFCFNRYY